MDAYLSIWRRTIDSTPFPQIVAEYLIEPDYDYPLGYKTYF